MRLLLCSQILLFLSCGSCVFNKTTETPERRTLVRQTDGISLSKELETVLSTTRVQQKWQRAFIQLMVEKSADEAWMLFSYSGYSDQGQFAIYSINNELELYHAAPNKRDDFERVVLKPEKLQVFRENVTPYETLPEYRRTSFDGISYEFVHLTKQETGYKVQKTFMNSLGLDKDADQSYRELVQIFTTLTK